jgi:hypothetical protein
MAEGEVFVIASVMAAAVGMNEYLKVGDLDDTASCI